MIQTKRRTTKPDNDYETDKKSYKFNLIDCFPQCILPTCDQKGTLHAHILPKQQDILGCTSKYLYCQGGVGSGKSLPFAVKCVHLACTIPNNRGIVSRLNYDDLFDSSWREVMDCFTRLADKNLIPEPKFTKKVQGQYTQIDLWNGSEIKAAQGKNWQRGLGANHGFFWVDDAQECQEEFFIGTNVSGGLLSRLRLPHVLFDPRTYSAQREHGSLHGMVSSNPPPYGHWLHKLFGDKTGTYNIGGDIITWMQTITNDNPFVGTSYATGLVAIQRKMGHSEGTAQRIIYGDSVKAFKGVPVYPQFKREVHVAPLKFRSDLPLIRSWDFGHDHPGVIFSNVFKCPYKNNHYFTLSEVSDAFNVTVYELYDNYVLPHTKALYPNASIIKDCGDKAGYKQSSASKDGRSDMKILIVEYKLPFRYRYMNIEPSLQYMRGLLKPKEPCPCGLPYIRISPKCNVLLDALDGGYHFSKPRNGGPTGIKPVKDKYFDDIADAWRYGAENYVKWGLDWDDQKELKNTKQNKPTSFNTIRNYRESSMIDWLNDVDKSMMEQLSLTNEIETV